MLVTFTCSAYADITMFGDVAVRLIKMMGHSGTIPSAIVAEDVAAALGRLKLALDAVSPAEETASTQNNEDESAVSLRHRAMPLIDLLMAAAAKQVNVMWDSNR
ncbi:hypothetical protein BI364_02125 [Acidihalobacter yilgarnensis]|uniref:DUF1840 domain-containing protein n=1 Tax=Acidihalobacter yilgarnensis TaxID=2819280 RepID=A0A1D8IKI7_9GAMM|nr:DUF1840 domain-containing protein [Acidihalobacter yilgarnensis]AOU96964.1 hypothetical protein BI364_02125 [Acidihalobacter yilgarnensis]